MKKVSVTAPGKLMLMGEHAVVYGYPCIVTAVNQCLKVTISENKDERIEIVAPQVKDTRFVEASIKYFEEKLDIKVTGICVTTDSTFSGIFGFGSSSAVTVAMLKALSVYFERDVSNDELFLLAYKVVLAVQGVGSGFDVAAAVYGGTFVYDKDQGRIRDLTDASKGMQLVVGYSGVKANTVKIVQEVAKQKEVEHEKITQIFSEIKQLVDAGEKCICASDWQALGALFSKNQYLLVQLSVSTQKLDAMVATATHAGAYGAKLSGAGGGDCMIALTGAEHVLTVAKAIEKVGGEIVQAKTNCPGVRVETTDDQKELFIIVDKDDKILEYRSRYDCHHDKSLMHRSVSLLVFHTDGRVLLQKRSMTKDTHPGYWTTAVGGHVTKGETYDQAIVRETREELGIGVIPVKHSVFSYAYPIETEMECMYTAVYDGPFHPSAEEIERVEFFTKKQLEDALKHGHMQLTELALYELRKVKFL